MSERTALHHLPELGVVLVAAGQGTRLGAGAPKAFVELGNATILEHSVRTIIGLPHPGELVIVVPESFASQALEVVSRTIPDDSSWHASVVPGGRERHESVRFGLAALGAHVRTVLIHDAARPLTPTAVFERVISAVHRTGGAAVPGIPVADTVKRVRGEVVVDTVDRAELVAVQTPQGFPRELIEAAHESTQARASHDRRAPTDDAEVVQRFGGTVTVVDGDALAHKVTTPADLRMLLGVLDASERD